MQKAACTFSLSFPSQLLSSPFATYHPKEFLKVSWVTHGVRGCGDAQHPHPPPRPVAPRLPGKQVAPRRATLPCLRRVPHWPHNWRTSQRAQAFCQRNTNFCPEQSLLAEVQLSQEELAAASEIIKPIFPQPAVCTRTMIPLFGVMQHICWH